MKRLAWPAAAIIATIVLIGLALTGGRGGPGLEPFVPKGLLAIPVEKVREVDVSAPRGHWHFSRAEGGWRATQGIATAGFEGRLDGALRLLRNSGPERVLTGVEVDKGRTRRNSVLRRHGCASSSPDPTLRCLPFRSARAIRWGCRTMRWLTAVPRSRCCRTSWRKHGSRPELCHDGAAHAMDRIVANARRLR